MAKQSMRSRKGQSNVGTFALEFVGSLFYLVLVYLMAADEMVASPVFANVGTFWLPVYVGIAIVSAIAMFFFSFTYLADASILSGMHTKNMGLILALASGITFLTLTVGSAYFIVALVGFVLSVIGGISGYRL
ncbi:MAG: hypothetical protein M1164_02210 [Candidatus Marsarchaeota archaeon]|nr:hypothetical protein [Candidatus Marsarchaeota archaeon]